MVLKKLEVHNLVSYRKILRFCFWSNRAAVTFVVHSQKMELGEFLCVSIEWSALMSREAILTIPCILLIFTWFVSDIQTNKITLSCAIIAVVAIGIVQATSIVLNKIKHKLEPTDQNWLILAQKKIRMALYIASCVSVFVCVDFFMALPQSRVATISALRINCRHTSNVPGRVSTELESYNGKICLKLSNGTGSLLYVPEKKVFRTVSIGEPVSLIVETADSQLFGVDTYFLNATIKK